jgi:hypothetical protein
MQRAAIFLIALSLTGCGPDRTQDIAACQREAARFYAPHRAIDPEDPVSRFIIGCMAAKGYDFKIAPAACNSARALPTQAACYASRTWLGWLVDRVRGE